MNSKTKYRALCEKDKTIPIFSKDWWLDAVCGQDNWDVLLVESNGQIIGAHTCFWEKYFGNKVLKQPPLTQNNGIWIKYPENQKYSKRLAFENKICDEIINQLEKLKVDSYTQMFHYSFTNWLPFYWRGYNQTTRYTYVIEDISDTEKMFEEGFDYSKKKNIKKASKLVEVKYDLSAEEFYKNHIATLKKQNMIISYSYEVFKNLYNALYKNNAGKVIYSIDKSGNIHSAILFCWDSNSAYDLVSTIDPEFRNSGSASLLVFEAIKYCSKFVNVFDFEGSMIKGVENSFRKFGAIQKPYFYITKDFNKNILYNALRKIFLKNKVLTNFYRLIKK